MSRLYAMITESARKTIPTARAHHAAAAAVKSWAFTASVRLVRDPIRDNPDHDTLTLTLTDLETGETVEVLRGKVFDLYKEACHKEACRGV